MKNIIITIEAARINKGFTQAYVAEHMGVSARTIQNWEAGRTSPDVNQAKMLAQLYDVSINNLKF